LLLSLLFFTSLTSTPVFYPLSLHDALPISIAPVLAFQAAVFTFGGGQVARLLQLQAARQRIIAAALSCSELMRHTPILTALRAVASSPRPAAAGCRLAIAPRRHYPCPPGYAHSRWTRLWINR